MPRTNTRSLLLWAIVCCICSGCCSGMAVMKGGGGPASSCRPGWVRFRDSCYLDSSRQNPSFPLKTYIEAVFWCNGQSSHLVSIADREEADFIASLIGDSRLTVWAGLVKVNPCRIEFGKAPICYMWADRSGPYRGFPAWLAGHPIQDNSVNCVALQGGSLLTAQCYEMHSFVCKVRGADTD